MHFKMNIELQIFYQNIASSLNNAWLIHNLKKFMMAQYTNQSGYVEKKVHD